MKEKPNSIRGAYERYGVAEFYASQGAEYSNPHEEPLSELLIQLSLEWNWSKESRILDLACGSGEVTLALESQGFSDLSGLDPYTGAAYLRRTGRRAEPISFEQIQAGTLVERVYDLIICSFALHLLEISRLPGLLYQLSLITPELIIISPHKRPQLEERWGWNLVEEVVQERIRARRYLSIV